MEHLSTVRLDIDNCFHHCYIIYMYYVCNMYVCMYDMYINTLHQKRYHWEYILRTFFVNLTLMFIYINGRISVTGFHIKIFRMCDELSFGK